MCAFQGLRCFPSFVESVPTLHSWVEPQSQGNFLSFFFAANSCLAVKVKEKRTLETGTYKRSLSERTEEKENRQMPGRRGSRGQAKDGPDPTFNPCSFPFV